MQTLEYRQQKIQEKRKQTPWKDFVREIASWFPLMFYKHHGTISKFPENSRMKQISSSLDFEKMRDNLTNTTTNSDIKNFFTEYGTIFQNIGIGNVIDFGGNENALFSECTQSSKNVYLSFVTILGCENILYSFSVKDNSKNVLNSLMVMGSSENIYQSVGIKSGYNIFFSKLIYDSNNIWYSNNLQGCSECILCSDLSNLSYCIENKQLEKDEYYAKKIDFLASLSRQNFILPASKQNPNIGCENTHGKYMLNSENIENGYMSSNLHNGKNTILVLSHESNESFYDVFCGGRSNDIYGGIVTGTFSSNVYNSMMISNSSNIFYCYGLNDCSYCIGCVGLKNKSFCILNKQYTKEERLEKANEIFQQMESEGTLGQFFPGWMNPFYFNDTAAYLIDGSFTKEEITKLGYLRRDEPIKVDIPEGSETVKIIDLNQYEEHKDGKWSINPDILKKVIIDDEGNSYRIIKMEYDFLMKYGPPLPRKHRLTRMKDNFKM